MGRELEHRPPIYARGGVGFVKTGPLDLKFGMETKFNMENSKIKEKLDIDTYLINYA